jgi:dTDP-4-amino-4,6-dideoxygalactose transaminase
VNNATTGLQIALKTFNPQKKIATTPFTYVSTLNAIKWLGLKEKFFDINLTNLNINEIKLNKKNLEDCSGILATHSFGNPCKIDKLEKISKLYNKFLIFDAAHCFGLKYKKKSILSFGDASVISFQATKFFNTCEGGAIIFKKHSDYLTAKKLSQIGYDYKSKDQIPSEGTNGKMSELNAAWGISLLKRVNRIYFKRKKIFIWYKQYLNKDINYPLCSESYNYTYFPIIFKTKYQLDKCIKELNINNIFPKKYFYPSLNKISNKKIKMPVSDEISSKICCLPMHEYLTRKQIKNISLIINRNYY